MLSWPPSLRQYSFLITSSLKNDEKCSPRSLSSSSVHFSLHSYLKMMRNAIMAPFSPPVFLLITFLLKMMRNALLAPVPLQCPFLIIFLSKMMRNDLLAPSLLQRSFLITFLFKNDEKCPAGSLPPPVFISHYILVQVARSNPQTNPNFYKAMSKSKCREEQNEPRTRSLRFGAKPWYIWGG